MYWVNFFVVRKSSKWGIWIWTQRSLVCFWDLGLIPVNSSKWWRLWHVSSHKLVFHRFSRQQHWKINMLKRKYSDPVWSTCVLPRTTIAVDNFTARVQAKATVYFLSHFHAGLLVSVFSSFIDYFEIIMRAYQVVSKLELFTAQKLPQIWSSTSFLELRRS